MTTTVAPTTRTARDLSETVNHVYTTTLSRIIPADNAILMRGSDVSVILEALQQFALSGHDEKHHHALGLALDLSKQIHGDD